MIDVLWTTARLIIMLIGITLMAFGICGQVRAMLSTIRVARKAEDFLLEVLDTPEMAEAIRKDESHAREKAELFFQMVDIAAQRKHQALKEQDRKKIAEAMQRRVESQSNAGEVLAECLREKMALR